MRPNNRFPFTACLLLAAGSASAQTLGEVCVPRALESRPGISCQATDDFEYRLPYVANADKGNVLLSAGCGMIGGLLRHVDPPQRFSHSGIFIENGTRLRHSTAVEERIIATAGSDGFTPSTLKYGWPGTVNESVDEAYEGRYLVDPEDSGRTFFVSSFNRAPEHCEGDVAPIYPSLVKPPFDQLDTMVPGTGRTVRANLARIAEAAQGIHGHYRFFAYSDAAIVGRASGAGGRAGTDAGWAHLNAPDGTVCSQLAWSSTVAAGVPVEDDVVEPGDRPHAPITRRGLYSYSEPERLAAGQWLYDRIYNQYYEQAGFWGRAFTDAPDDGANQILNCFGFDWCGSEPGMEFDGEPDAKDSDRWRHPGEGFAVAPDDITHWDLPPAGVYGLTEEIAYRPGEYLRVHRWAASQGTGGVVASVTFNGSPASGALVILSGFPAMVTDASGHANFVAIPAGRYELSATKTVVDTGSPREVTARQVFDVQADVTNQRTLALTSAPPTRPDATRSHRRVRVQGTVWIKDHENFGSNEEGTHSINASIVLDPVGLREHTFRFSHCTGDEVRVETEVRVSLTPADLSVVAEVRGKMFEGDDCDTDEEEGSLSQALTVPEGGMGNVNLELVNGYVFGDDEARIQLTVVNERNAP